MGSIKIIEKFGCLKGLEGPFYLQKLLVSQGDILGCQGVVTGGDNILPIQLRLLTDLAAVNLDGPVLEKPKVPAHCPMGHRRTDALLMGFPLLIPQLKADLFYLGQNLLPCGLVLFDLFRIVYQNKPSTFLPAADGHLLDLQVIPNLEISSPLGQNLFLNLLVVPKPFAQDILTTRLLKNKPILFRVQLTI